MDNQSQVQPQVTNTQISPKKRRSWFWGCLSAFLVFLLIVGCAVGGYFAVNYLNQNRGNLLNTNRSNRNNTDSREFTSEQQFNAESDLIKLVEESQPAVVTVTVKAPRSLRDRNLDLQERRTIGSGTGFFISRDGLLITNEHVVCGARAQDLVVVTADQRTFTVRSVSADPTQDVAILRVDTRNEDIKTLRFANPESQIRVGQEVIAIGNPFGDNPGTVTRGIVSGLNRNITAQGSCDGANQLKDYEGVIQTDAAINSGNSGGPLLNLRGEVVGVNSATLRGANNISYTVPFTTVLRTIDNYNRNNGRILLPFIGVSHNMISPERAQANNVPVGALVTNVGENTPASRAGIRDGDIITKIGDKRINFSLVSTLNQNFQPNQSTTVEVYRSDNEDFSNGRTLTLNITIGQREP